MMLQSKQTGRSVMNAVCGGEMNPGKAVLGGKVGSSLHKLNRLTSQTVHGKDTKLSMKPGTPISTAPGSLTIRSFLGKTQVWTKRQERNYFLYLLDL